MLKFLYFTSRSHAAGRDEECQEQFCCFKLTEIIKNFPFYEAAAFLIENEKK